MIYKIGDLRCAICHEIVNPRDRVVLDIINTVIHQKCFMKHGYRFELKDGGRFLEVAKRNKCLVESVED